MNPLEQSNDMSPVAGTIDVAIPIDVLWECFSRPDHWSDWNPCIFWVENHELALGDELVWAFEPIHWWWLYKLPARATIVELEPGRKITWEVTFLPGFYARHTYSLEDLGKGRTRFGSWEQAMGPSFQLLAPLWLMHFMFVKDRSLEGAQALEAVYKRKGNLDSKNLPRKDYAPSLLPLAIVLAIWMVVSDWFD